jgi:hypothetical protein
VSSTGQDAPRRVWAVRRPIHALIFTIAAVGVIGWALFLRSTLQQPQDMGLNLPPPPAVVATDRVAAVVADQPGGGVLVGQVLESSVEPDGYHVRLRLENRSSSDVPTSQTEFTVPEATPPVSLASSGVTETLTLPPGGTADLTLTFAGQGEGLLWCPRARPGTCIRL